MSDEYVAFAPVYARGERLVVCHDPMSTELREKIEAVLTFYGVPFCEDASGALLVSTWLANDLDTMWNYTTKAIDPEWLATHRPEDAPGRR